MAVEASHLTPFPPHNSEMIYETAYGSKTNSFPAPDFKQLNELTSCIPLSRKRSRDSSLFNPPFTIPNAPNVNLTGNLSSKFTFLGEDVSSQIYQQELEIDRLIAQHTENVRSDMEQIRKQNTRRLIVAVNETMKKRLKTKEEEILQIGRLNWSLEERVRSLNVENQILKQLVQANEATANGLRNKLQQVLAEVQVQQQQQQQVDFGNNAKARVVVDEGESQCGSNYEEDNRQAVEGERKVIDSNYENEDCNGNSSRYGRNERCCRKCGKEESCVLLLPCRHLCVCALCVSSVSFCPICSTTKSAGLHVNITTC